MFRGAFQRAALRQGPLRLRTVSGVAKRSKGLPVSAAVVPAVQCLYPGQVRWLSVAAESRQANVLSPLANETMVEMQEIQPPLSERHLPPFQTLAELMANAVERYAEQPCLGIKQNGKYSFKTYREVGALVDQCRAALDALGLEQGDSLGIISRNRLEWVLSAYGGYGLGLVHVPMYEQQKEEDWRYIVEDSDAKVLVASTEEIYNKVKAFEGSVGHCRRVFCCDLPEDHPDSFASLMRLGEGKTVPARTIAPSDLATLIYTSGTTGKPKGVMLAHSNLVSNVKAQVDHAPRDTMFVTPKDRSVAFLPWAHSYGQTCELHSGLAIGASTGIAAGAPGDVPELLSNIQEIQPTLLFSVPTLFKKVYDGIHKRVDEETGVKKVLMQRALDVSEQMRQARVSGQPPGPWLQLQYRMLDRLVLSKFRAPFGGQLRLAVVAGAPTPVAVLKFMESLGVSMIEGYGLTETSPVVSITWPNPEDRVNGTVGRPIPGVDIRIVKDGQDVAPGGEGELWVSGPNVLQGYWKQPEATAEVFEHCEEGKRWFRTGDLATVIDDGHIKITGRIKEQYKLENGKYVAPAPIEEAFLLNRYFAQCVLFGDGKPHNVLVVVPDFAAIAEQLKIEEDPEAMVQDPRVVQLLDSEMASVIEKKDIKKYEAPKKLLLLSEPFSAANEMLTPKLSVRKPNVIKAYRDRLEGLYA
mmetsp:Transcript_10507/g.30097  ORF Transcript_10507/g.30097 Transcript_10507/m.30097 type:complete len:695 (-) Transcript_10507:841-2925(-)